jgi:DNA helicase HerA-like ATPase
MKRGSAAPWLKVCLVIVPSVSLFAMGEFVAWMADAPQLSQNKFFQRHAIIVGSTGSGKSWTTARVLECMAGLPNANGIVFDIHGEYRPLKGDGIRHLRIAGPKDLDAKSTLKDGVVHLPYWLLAYEAMVSMFVDRSDQNAPNRRLSRELSPKV